VMDDDRMLRESLQVKPLSAAALSRIRAVAESEWRANLVERRPRRWLPYAAAAILLALMSAGGLFLAGVGREDLGEPAARLMRSETSGVFEVHALRQDIPLKEGSVVRSARNFRVNGQALFELEGGGSLRVASGSEFEIVARDVVRLTSGEMYVDIPPGAHADASFVAVTGAGEFRHLGTQFAIAVVNGTTRLRVREGQVQWHAADGDATLPAGTEVLIDRHMNVTRAAVESTGQQWSWTETMAPEIDIDNRPLGEFLDWFARETGRRLVIADGTTQHQIDSIRMHGSVHGLTPMQALKAVMASTSLRFDLPAGAIRVSFAGDPPTST